MCARRLWIREITALALWERAARVWGTHGKLMPQAFLCRRDCTQLERRFAAEEEEEEGRESRVLRAKLGTREVRCPCGVVEVGGRDGCCGMT